MKVRDLFTDESKWTQGVMARMASGASAATCDPNAYCRCLGGAIIYCYGEDYTRVELSDQVLRKVMNKIGTDDIVEWNDDPDRTFAEVKALIEELDI